MYSDDNNQNSNLIPASNIGNNDQYDQSSIQKPQQYLPQTPVANSNPISLIHNLLNKQNSDPASKESYAGQKRQFSTAMAQQQTDLGHGIVEKENNGPLAKKFHADDRNDSPVVATTLSDAIDDTEANNSSSVGTESSECETSSEQQQVQTKQQSLIAQNTNDFQAQQHTPQQQYTDLSKTDMGNPLAHSTPFLGPWGNNGIVPTAAAFQQMASTCFRPEIGGNNPNQAAIGYDYFNEQKMMSYQMQSRNGIAHHSNYQFPIGGQFMTSAYSNPSGHYFQQLGMNPNQNVHTSPSSLITQLPSFHQTNNFSGSNDSGMSMGANATEFFYNNGFLPLGYGASHNNFNKSTYNEQKMALAQATVASIKHETSNSTTSGASNCGGINESSYGRPKVAAAPNDINNPRIEAISPGPMCKPYLTQAIIDGVSGVYDLENLVHCEVPARLAILGYTMKYPVTLAEIHRRIYAPEMLNSSYLCAILRKAKNKNGGKDLRETLRDIGFILPPGRRKCAQSNTFSTLCEREAIKLANDFGQIAAINFPIAQIASILNRSNIHSHDDAQKRLSSVKAAKQILDESMRILELGIEDEMQPLNAQGGTVQAVPPFDNATRDGFIKHSRRSHGFGNRAILAAWKLLSSMFTASEEQITKALSTGNLSFASEPINIRDSLSSFLPHQQPSTSKNLQQKHK